MFAPAHRIETERLVVRCYEPSDVDAVHDAILRNREHLARFMPWAANEPMSLADRTELLRRFRGQFELKDEYFYGVFLHSGAFVASTGLHPRCGPEGVEVGYWVDLAHGGQGLVTEAVAAVVKHALVDLALDRVELRIEPSNLRSTRVAERLGFTREAVLARRIPFQQELRDVAIWTLFRHALPQAPRVNWARYRAFDARGQAFG